VRCDNCGKEASAGRALHLIAGAEHKVHVARDQVVYSRSDFTPFSVWFCAQCIQSNRRVILRLCTAGVAAGVTGVLVGWHLSRTYGYNLEPLMGGMGALAFFGLVALVSNLVSLDLKEAFGDRLKQLVRERLSLNAFWTTDEFAKMQRKP